MSDPTEGDEGGEGEEEQQEMGEGSEPRSEFRAAAESGEVTIGDLVEVDEDEDEDEEFDPNDEAEDEEDEEGDEGDEEEEEEGIDEEELEALREAGVDAAVERHIDETTAAEEDAEEAEAEGGAHDEEGDEEDDGEGDDEEGGAFEGGAGMMNEAALGAFVGSVMTADGPTVNTVLLKADGTTVQRLLDMTPRLDTASGVLGSKSSFVGQYPSLQVVILQRRDQTNTELPINAHKLPAPFDSEVVRGDMLLVRMDDRSEPQHFTVDEWETFGRSAAAEEAATANGAATTANGEGGAGERQNKRQRRR